MLESLGSASVVGGGDASACTRVRAFVRVSHSLLNDPDIFSIYSALKKYSFPHANVD